MPRCFAPIAITSFTNPRYASAAFPFGSCWKMLLSAVLTSANRTVAGITERSTGKWPPQFFLTAVTMSLRNFVSFATARKCGE